MDIVWVTLSSLLFVLVCFDAALAKDKNNGHGHWGEWGQWSACSTTCGSGITELKRQWIPGPKDPPSKDPYTSSKVMSCMNKEVPYCPQDGKWSGWMAWTQCTKACGQGTKKRTRDCRGQRYHGSPCSGEKEEETSCKREPCPVLPRNFNMSLCTSKNFTCTSQKMCVPAKQKCDGTVQCHDGTDEMGCSRWSPGVGSIKYNLSREGGAGRIAISTLLELFTVLITVYLSADWIAAV